MERRVAKPRRGESHAGNDGVEIAALQAEQQVGAVAIVEVKGAFGVRAVLAVSAPGTTTRGRARSAFRHTARRASLRRSSARPRETAPRSPGPHARAAAAGGPRRRAPRGGWCARRGSALGPLRGAGSDRKTQRARAARAPPPARKFKVVAAASKHRRGVQIHVRMIIRTKRMVQFRSF